MKKIVAFVLAVALVAALNLNVAAATPVIKVPHIEIPDITVSVRESVKDTLSPGFWNSWFKDHPFRIDWRGFFG